MDKILGMDLQSEVLKIIKDHKFEILKDKDWWHGFPEHDINVFQQDENDKFTISIYKMDSEGNFDYNNWQNLPSLTFAQILYL